MHGAVGLDTLGAIGGGGDVERATLDVDVARVLVLVVGGLAGGGVVPSRSHCMPSSPTPLMLSVPLSMRKYSLQLMPSLAACTMLRVAFFSVM